MEGLGQICNSLYIHLYTLQKSAFVSLAADIDNVPNLAAQSHFFSKYLFLVIKHVKF